jgi:hypothetical protein
MLRLIIPALAALIGAAVLFGAGAFENRAGGAAEAFLDLLHASHTAAVAANPTPPPR